MNLVLQGPSLEKSFVDLIASRVGAKTVERISERAFRLKGGAPEGSVSSLCEERRIDHAWVPEGRRFADLRLLAMDMDSTLITIECIDELGELAGKKSEVAGITAQAMRGEVDYAASLRRRVSLLAGMPESSLERVYEERLRLTAGAEALLAACKRQSIKVLLVSGGFTFFTERLKARLAIDYTISNRLEVSAGKLTGNLVGDIVDADAKAAKFSAVLSELRGEKARSLAIGDGANDLKMMALAGLSVAFRAKPAVRAKADCAIDFCGLDAAPNLFE
jgi:phosphoserine phosphatase